jgi:hypothetical protein
MLIKISDELHDIAQSCKPLGEDDQVAVVEEASNVVPFPK